MRLPILLAIAALPAPGPAVGDRFDLVCSGTRTFRDPLAAKPVVLPYATELRIDLAAHVYCYGACQRTRPIAAADAETIALERRNAARTTDLPVEDTTIDRRTGAYRSDVSAPAPDRQTTSIHATCRAAPFKAMPAPDARY